MMSRTAAAQSSATEHLVDKRQRVKAAIASGARFLHAFALAHAESVSTEYAIAADEQHPTPQQILKSPYALGAGGMDHALAREDQRRMHGALAILAISSLALRDLMWAKRPSAKGAKEGLPLDPNRLFEYFTDALNEDDEFSDLHGALQELDWQPNLDVHADIFGLTSPEAPRMSPIGEAYAKAFARLIEAAKDGTVLPVVEDESGGPIAIPEQNAAQGADQGPGA